MLFLMSFSFKGRVCPSLNADFTTAGNFCLKIWALLTKLPQKKIDTEADSQTDIYLTKKK